MKFEPNFTKKLDLPKLIKTDFLTTNKKKILPLQLVCKNLGCG